MTIFLNMGHIQNSRQQRTHHKDPLLVTVFLLFALSLPACSGVPERHAIAPAPPITDDLLNVAQNTTYIHQSTVDLTETSIKNHDVHIAYACNTAALQNRDYLVGYQWDTSDQSHALALDFMDSPSMDYRYEREASAGLLLSYRFKLQTVKTKKKNCQKNSVWQGSVGWALAN